MFISAHNICTQLLVGTLYESYMGVVRGGCTGSSLRMFYSIIYSFLVDSRPIYSIVPYVIVYFYVHFIVYFYVIPNVIVYFIVYFYVIPNVIVYFIVTSSVIVHFIVTPCFSTDLRPIFIF